MSTIASLDIELNAKLDKFSRGLKDASGQAEAFEKDMAEKMKGSGGIDTASLAASFAPLGAMLGASLAGGLKGAMGGLTASMDKIGATLSRQLGDHLTFVKIQDGISTTRDMFRNRVREMEISFAEFKAKSSSPADIAKFKAGLDSMKGQYDKFLMHSSASLKKGGINPNIDTFFSTKSRTYSGSKGSADVGASAGTLGAIGKAADKAKSSVHGFGMEVAAALGFFALGYKAVDFFKGGIKGAADLNETLSKTDAILGDATPAVTKFADEMASKFGLVKRKTLDVADSFAGLGKGLGGLTGKSLSDFSTKFAGLAADLSSYANMDFETAAKALSTGLAGNQSDVLKGLGVVVDDAKVKQYALAHGMRVVGGELTENSKLMARAALISEGLRDATGDLDKTQDSVANKTRKFHGQIENLATSIGQMLIPAVSKGLDILTEFGAWAQSSFEGAKSSFEALGAALSETFEAIGGLFRNWQAVFEIARLKIVEGLMNIGAQFDALGQNVGTIAAYVAENWVDLLRDAFNASLSLLKNLWKNFEAVGQSLFDWLQDPMGGFKVDWTPLLDGFEATAKELPDLMQPHLIDMGKEIQEQMDKITEAEAKRVDGSALKNKPGRNVPIPKPGDTAKFDVPKMAAALDIHSVEARSNVLSAMAGSGGRGLEQSSKQTAVNTGRTAKALEDFNKKFQIPPEVVFKF
jgi:hypothetical protein